MLSLFWEIWRRMASGPDIDDLYRKYLQYGTEAPHDQVQPGRATETGPALPREFDVFETQDNLEGIVAPPESPKEKEKAELHVDWSDVEDSD